MIHKLKEDFKMVKTYRLKPKKVKAILLNKDSIMESLKFVGKKYDTFIDSNVIMENITKDEKIVITNLLGEDQIAKFGQYIIKDENDNIYVMNEEKFNRIYEEV
jgi:hypothetical protein